MNERFVLYFTFQIHRIYLCFLCVLIRKYLYLYHLYLILIFQDLRLIKSFLEMIRKPHPAICSGVIKVGVIYRHLIFQPFHMIIQYTIFEFSDWSIYNNYCIVIYYQIKCILLFLQLNILYICRCKFDNTRVSCHVYQSS